MDEGKAVSESVAHSSERSRNLHHCERVSYIKQLKTKRPVKEGIFTPSLLSCLIVGARTLLRCVHRETEVEQISLQTEMRKKKVGKVLRGITFFLLTTSATEYNRKNQSFDSLRVSCFKCLVAAAQSRILQTCMLMGKSSCS